MGDHEGWARPPSGLLPNGLLPNKAANVLQVLESVQWSKAEERTAELIQSIQPNAPSEWRRNMVAEYVKRLIMKCFPCQVFTFGSVPLKTYLPDGDIDLTAFSKNQNLKDTWAHQVRDMLQSEEKNQNAEFRVKEVQYIQAEVKIIKCLVENIVVDISFNQLGGLCTLCFLEEVGNLINHNYLFKRSIILIKAWCYYESRVLGAHHGLISTYALEALVLYIFHVYNNSFSGPLEVLYRFLEFFSKFDWDNFCVSLWGPVPISSLPDVTAKPPRQDGGDLLLSKEFLERCSSTYAVFPGGQENQGQPFLSKHFNVIDPLRVNNNLGRSVSKGNFFRIRSAFAFGEKRLAKLLECPEKDISFEINQFFMNTWERHGSGRPDAPSNDLGCLRLPNPEQLNESKGPKNNSRDRSNVFSSFKSQGVGVRQSLSLNSQQDHSLLETTSRSSNVATTSRVQAESKGRDQDSSKIEQRKNEINVSQSTINKIQQCSDHDSQGRFLIVRTYSSPELTDSYGEVSSLVIHNETPDCVKPQTYAGVDSSGRKKLELNSLARTSIGPSTDYSSIGHELSQNNPDAVVDINNYPDDSESSVIGEDSSPGVRAQGVHEEGQDHVNLVGLSMAHSFNGLVHVPLNMGSGHMQFPILPSVIDSMGFGQRNFSGMVPSNIPLIETSWGSNVHFPHGLMSSSLSHYFPGIGLNTSLEDPCRPGNGNSGFVERSSREVDEFCHEQDRDSVGGFADDGAIEMPRSDNKLQSTSGAYNLSPSRRSLPGNYKRVLHRFTKENHGPISEEHGNNFKYYQDDKGNEFHLDDKIANSRSSPVARASSVRSKTSSESSWDGTSAKVSKSMREKRGRKTAYSVVPSSAKEKCQSVLEQSSGQIDDYNRDTDSTVMAEKSIGHQSVSSLHIQRHEVPGYEMAESSGPEPILPLGPVLIGPPCQQRGLDNSGAVPFAFYPTGPPIPFVTMVPFFNFPSEGTSDASTSHFSGHELADRDSGQSFDSSVRHDHPEILSTSSPRTATSTDPSECKGGDILNSDFPRHLQNLQYGRSCQNYRFPSAISPSNVDVPPMYVQGRYPWDGPGRPLSGNMNPITLGYGSRVVPVAPFHAVSNRPTNVYQHYTDEMPRYRSGTGTYLPNPKVAGRDRHSTSGRRGHYNLGDHQADKEDNWNLAKSRGAGRSHGRNQAEKANLRMNANQNRAERPWGSRHNSQPPYKSQSGPLHHSNATHSGSAYRIHSQRGLNRTAVSSNGASIPSVVMLYPYDHISSYASPTEQLEFGSLGPIGFSSIGEASQPNDGNQSGSTLDNQRFHGSPNPQSPPDQPSSNY